MKNVDSVVCTFCGCLCDDIRVSSKDDGTIEIKGACANGKGHMEEYDPSPVLPPSGVNPFPGRKRSAKPTQY